MVDIHTGLSVSDWAKAATAQVERADRATAERDAGLAEAAVLRAALEMVEWNNQWGITCPWCHASWYEKNRRHAPDCRRQLALTASPLAEKAAAVLAAARILASLLVVRLEPKDGRSGVEIEAAVNAVLKAEMGLVEVVRALDGASQR